MPNSVSLKVVLQSPSIPKVVFDIRNDSDARFSHYQIRVDGIKDLQLMELAPRKDSKALAVDATIITRSTSTDTSYHSA